MEQVWYIKLHRKTLESEIWHKPAAWFKIWSYILMEVNFKENWLPEWSKYMSYEWIRLGCPGVSWGQIDKFFRWSKSVDSLSTSKSTRWMVVSVANYSQYQCIEKTPKSIAKSMTSRWPVDTIIEEGKKKEDNTNVLSLVVPITKLDQTLLDFKIHRKEIKRPIGSKWMEAILEKLSIYDEDTQIKMLKESIANGWQWVFQLKAQKNEDRKEAMAHYNIT